MNKNTMNARDAISGALAECYFTINGKRYNFMQLKSFESSFKPNVSGIAILGKTSQGHKYSGGSGEWSGTAHYNQSILREMMYRYQNEGIVTYFDIQTTNEDPTSSVGRQTIILRDCLCDSSILAKFDADSDTLTEDISGTFDSWEMPEKFSTLKGM